MVQKKSDTKNYAQNKKAFFDYEILETFEAGIVLQGTEVKSIKLYHASLKEAYIKIIKNELLLIGCHIPTYSCGTIYNHQEQADRKLLVHKYEIRKLKALIQEKRMTLVPLALYPKQGKIKLKFGLAKGKKQADKRQHLKEKEMKREAARALKNR